MEWWGSFWCVLRRFGGTLLSFWWGGWKLFLVTPFQIAFGHPSVDLLQHKGNKKHTITKDLKGQPKMFKAIKENKKHQKTSKNTHVEDHRSWFCGRTSFNCFSFPLAWSGTNPLGQATNVNATKDLKRPKNSVPLLCAQVKHQEVEIHRENPGKREKT